MPAALASSHYMQETRYDKQKCPQTLPTRVKLPPGHTLWVYDCQGLGWGFNHNTFLLWPQTFPCIPAFSVICRFCVNLQITRPRGTSIEAFSLFVKIFYRNYRTILELSKTPKMECTKIVLSFNAKEKIHSLSSPPPAHWGCPPRHQIRHKPHPNTCFHRESLY